MDVQETPISPETPVLTLPARSPSVTLHRRVSLSEEASAQPSSGSGLARQNSLEETRNYYNLHPATSPTAGLNRAPSAASRVSTGTRKHRSNSRTSSSGRPDVTSPVPSLPTSPSRSSVPLPTPRGFLSPKKAPAALRLEQQERAAASRNSQSDIQSLYGRGTLSARTSAEFSGRSESRGIRSPTPPPVSLDAILATGPSLNRQSLSQPPPPTAPPPSVWDDTLRHSRTDTSSPIPAHRLHELSSDHLINASLGRTAEKGIAPNGYSSGSIERNRKISQRDRRDDAPVKSVKKYQKLEKSGSTFFFGGRLMTGGDSPISFILSMVILFGISGVWVGTTGVWLWVHGDEYGLASGGGIGVMIVFVYLFGLTVGSLVAAAFREPGIIPRNLDLNPPYSQTSSDYWDAVPRELKVGKGQVTVKYCETCKIYRPPRSSHCRLCGNCIDGIDHHCAYIHTCVGKRTYLAFLTFVITAAFSTIYIVVFSAVHFALLCSHDHIYFKDALADSPGAAVSFALGILVLPPMMFLLSYHVRLLLYNLTTIEQIRASASKSLLKVTKRPENPFADPSTFKNILNASLGRPQFPSWINASGWVEEESRRVNPGVKKGRSREEI